MLFKQQLRVCVYCKCDDDSDEDKLCAEHLSGVSIKKSFLDKHKIVFFVKMIIEHVEIENYQEKIGKYIKKHILMSLILF